MMTIHTTTHQLSQLYHFPLPERPSAYGGELIVDLFAGGGGASSGIENALGRPVDYAINHNPVALAMHEANHPFTTHRIEDVFAVDPRQLCAGKPVGLLWLSPDCRHHSRARGGKPADRRIRGLAWVALKWAGQVRPKVIMLENVPEFSGWCKLIAKRDAAGRTIRQADGSYELCADPKSKGQTFKRFVKLLENYGYAVEWRCLSACDYGSPTSRKRLFLIARCDGQAISWPNPTHGPRGTQPHRTAGECVDWNLPTVSIFERPKPLATATLRRIGRGLAKFVVNNPKPYLVRLPNQKEAQLESEQLCSAHVTKFHGTCAGASFEQPLPTITGGGELKRPAGNSHALGVVAAHITRFQQCSLEQPITAPLETVMSGATRFGLVAASILKAYGGGYTGSGASLDAPTPTITTCDHNHLLVAHVARDFTESIGHAMDAPLATTTAGGGGGKSCLVCGRLELLADCPNTSATKYEHAVYELLLEYAPQALSATDHATHTVGVTIGGERFVITDVSLRMFQPAELYRAQGFDDRYDIAPIVNGKRLSKTAQVKLVGNSVCPQVASALVKANLRNVYTNPKPLGKNRRPPSLATA